LSAEEEFVVVMESFSILSSEEARTLNFPKNSGFF
jgi:hypothetical protein